jgi:hypothetical protein
MEFSKHLRLLHLTLMNDSREAFSGHRRITVVQGLSQILSEVSSDSRIPRLWIPSSVELISRPPDFHCESLLSVAFECDTKLSRIEKNAFCSSGLTSIHLPSSVEVLCESCFSRCQSLTSVTFESDTKLSRIEKNAFYSSGLTSIHLPSSIEVLCEKCLSVCTRVPSVTSTPAWCTLC